MVSDRLDTYLPRVNFGRRLEPSGHSVLHGAGQSPESFAEYFAAVGHTKPIVYMTYVSLKDDLPTYFASLNQELAAYHPFHLVPQIGLYMNGGGLAEHPGPNYEQEVADGHYDTPIALFCEGLHQLQRPAFVRIGFEFNGSWNGYQPKPFRAAWRRIVSAFRHQRLAQVAAVWCYCPLPSSREQAGRRDRDYAPYYPGDEWVDWWSLDLFDRPQFAMENTAWFLAEAHRRRFPVMIGESTPRGVGGVQNGQVAWQAWFEPYFRFIRTQPTVKAFCYINWNWDVYPSFRGWGDARIDQNELVLQNYRRELASALYRHAAPAG
jgi:hypothetical protein